MKIECVPGQRRNVFLIQVDEEEWRQVHTSIFGKRFSFLKSAQTIEGLTEIFNVAEYKGAKLCVLRCLTRRSYASEELAEFLRERLVSESAIERVIREFTELGYLDDAQLVERLVTQLTAQGRGPSIIRQKLRYKGISSDLIESALATGSDKEQRHQAIAKLLETRYKRRDLTDYRTRQKVVASLLRRGFSLDDVLTAMRH